MLRKLFAPVLTAGLIAASLAAVAYAQTAGNSVFFTSKGDIVFPFTPPTKSGTAGTIDNMVIGSGTPRAGRSTAARPGFPAPSRPTLSASGARYRRGLYGSLRLSAASRHGRLRRRACTRRCARPGS
jgi:hypothetical protein